MISALPFVLGDAAPLIRRYLTRLAPGSYLALTHVTPPSGEQIRRRQAEVTDTYNAKVPQNIRLGTREEVSELFEGTNLMPPGLVLATHWNPPRGYLPAPDDQASAVLVGGVGRVRRRSRCGRRPSDNLPEWIGSRRENSPTSSPSRRPCISVAQRKGLAWPSRHCRRPCARSNGDST